MTRGNNTKGWQLPGDGLKIGGDDIMHHDGEELLSPEERRDRIRQARLRAFGNTQNSPQSVASKVAQGEDTTTNVVQPEQTHHDGEPHVNKNTQENHEEVTAESMQHHDVVHPSPLSSVQTDTPPRRRGPIEVAPGVTLEDVSDDESDDESYGSPAASRRERLIDEEDVSEINFELFLDMLHGGNGQQTFEAIGLSQEELAQLHEQFRLLQQLEDSFEEDPLVAWDQLNLDSSEEELNRLFTLLRGTALNMPASSQSMMSEQEQAHHGDVEFHGNTEEQQHVPVCDDEFSSSNKHTAEPEEHDLSKETSSKTKETPCNAAPDVNKEHVQVMTFALKPEPVQAPKLSGNCYNFLMRVMAHPVTHVAAVVLFSASLFMLGFPIASLVTFVTGMLIVGALHANSMFNRAKSASTLPEHDASPEEKKRPMSI